MPTPPPPSAQPLILTLALIILLALAAIIAFQSYRRVQRNLAAHSTATVNDLARWTDLLPHMLHDHAPYLDDAFPYPPIALAILSPLTLLSQPAAQVADALLKIPLIIAIFLLAYQLVRTAAAPPSLNPSVPQCLSASVPPLLLNPLALSLLLFTWLWPLIGDLQNGQTNLLMLFPLLLGLRLLQSRSPASDILAGLLIALAIAIKVTPLIFLPYLLLQRRWIALAASFAGLILWLLLLPALLFGWSQNLTWLSQWAHIMILPYVQHAQVQYSTGQSLPSVLSRLLEHIPAFQLPPSAPDLPKTDIYINLLDLPPATVHLLTRLLLAITALAGAWWMRKPLPSFRSQTYILHLAALASFMLWASERTWIHHYVTLLLPLFALTMLLTASKLTPRARLAAYTTLSLTALTFLFTSDAAHLFGKNAGDYLRAYALPLLSSILLLTTTLLLARTSAANSHPN